MDKAVRFNKCQPCGPESPVLWGYLWLMFSLKPLRWTEGLLSSDLIQDINFFQPLRTALGGQERCVNTGNIWDWTDYVCRTGDPPGPSRAVCLPLALKEGGRSEAWLHGPTGGGWKGHRWRSSWTEALRNMEGNMKESERSDWSAVDGNSGEQTHVRVDLEPEEISRRKAGEKERKTHVFRPLLCNTRTLQA